MRAVLSPRARQGISRVALALLGVVLGLLLGWLAIRGTQWREVAQALKGVSPLTALLALAIFLLSNWVRSLRWRLLWLEERVTTLRLFWIENAANGLNNIAPVRAMDEAFEFGILALRDRLPVGSIVATMMMCRIHDLFFTLLFMAYGLTAFRSLFRFTPVIVFTGLFFLGWLVLLLNFGWVLRRFPRLRHLPVVVPFERAVNSMWARPRRMGVVFLCTATYWLLLVPAGWLLAREVGISLPPHRAVVTVLGAVFFSTAVPSLPGALGTFEFAVVSLLDIWGVAREPAVTFAILLHALLFIPPSLFTVVALPLEGIRSLGALREVLERWQRHREAQRTAQVD